MPNTEWLEIAARLGIAVLLGAVLGINRDLHHKPAGLRTHALVSLGSAVAVISVTFGVNVDAGSLSRVIQGLVTGVGFIGAGVILHHDSDRRIAGLTTAASVWVAAILGAAAGAGKWPIALVALVFTIAVLAFGGQIERALERRFGREKGPDPARSPPP